MSAMILCPEFLITIFQVLRQSQVYGGVLCRQTQGSSLCAHLVCRCDRCRVKSRIRESKLTADLALSQLVFFFLFAF